MPKGIKDPRNDWTGAMTKRFAAMARSGMRQCEIAREMGLTPKALANRVVRRPHLQKIWADSRTVRAERTAKGSMERRCERYRKAVETRKAREKEAAETQGGEIAPELRALAEKATAARQRREDIRAYYRQPQGR